MKKAIITSLIFLLSSFLLIAGTTGEKPDLIITGIKVTPLQSKPQLKLNISITVKNIGKANVMTPFIVRLYYRTGPENSWIRLKDWKCSPVPAEAEKTFSFGSKFKKNGTIKFRAEADVLNQVDEASESNNFYETPIELQNAIKGAETVPAILKTYIDDSSKTQVLIVGTPHLRVLSDCFKFSLVDSLLSILEHFKPDLIGIESLPPDLLEDMERKGGNFKEILDAFAKNHIKYGHIAQKILNCSRKEAEIKANSILQNTDRIDFNTRLKIVVYLLAAYDYYSALLQWAYLPENIRKQDKILPESVSNHLNEALKSPNEIQAISIPLAKRLGLQKLISIDDHYDDYMLSKIGDKLLDELKNSPLYQEILKSNFYADLNKRLKKDCQDEDLLPVYLYINSSEYMSTDVATQWGFFFKTKFPSGLDRTRFDLWEVRNLNIASNIRKATASYPGKRMLVIIGAAHKPFIDTYLSQMIDIKLVHLNDILKSYPPKHRHGVESCNATSL